MLLKSLVFKAESLGALHWHLLAELTEARDPEAWAAGLQQIERPRGVSRANYNRLQAA